MDLGQGPHLRRGVRAGSLRTPEPSARGKTLGRKRKKCHRRAKKTYLYIYSNIYKMRREIPGVKEVDEKGHEGNTAEVRLVLMGTVS